MVLFPRSLNEKAAVPEAQAHDWTSHLLPSFSTQCLPQPPTFQTFSRDFPLLGVRDWRWTQVGLPAMSTQTHFTQYEFSWDLVQSQGGFAGSRHLEEDLLESSSSEADLPIA